LNEEMGRGQTRIERIYGDLLKVIFKNPRAIRQIRVCPRPISSISVAENPRPVSSISVAGFF
jgi:hypothetical protein